MNARCFALLAAIAAFSLPAAASAYCRTRTCDPTKREERCEVDEDDCVLTGAELFWPSACVSFNVQEDGSRAHDIEADAIAAIAEDAFGTWLASECGDGAPSIEVDGRGPVECDASEYNSRGHNANIIVMRDEEWPYPGAIDTFGFTRVRFDKNTGEIFDADIEINSADFAISAEGGADGVDLRSILTHEIGHFFGLGHAGADAPNATMSPGWNGDGTDLRSLANDDEAGLCAIYPPGRRTASASCEPRHGFASACGVPLPPAETAPPAPAGGGCGVARAATPLASFLVAVPIAALLLSRRRHTRAAFATRSSPSPANRQKSAPSAASTAQIDTQCLRS